jgi:hypothetical protein
VQGQTLARDALHDVLLVHIFFCGGVFCKGSMQHLICSYSISKVTFESGHSVVNIVRQHMPD